MGDNALTKELSTKVPSINHGKPLLESLVRRVHKTTKLIQAIFLALGCLLEPEGKILLLKIPQPLDIGLGGNQEGTHWKPSP